MYDTLIAILAALPFLVVPLVTTIRVRRSASLNDESSEPPAGAPLVSVVIPARNEAHNIGACIQSVLGTTYPSVEVIVVDDASSDGTGEIVGSFARSGARLRLVQNPPLPDGWFGKQWACENGALASSGSIILFADADTRHSPDLLTRSVNAMTRRSADLFTVIGKQEIVSFWEKLVQPQIFAIMAIRYGGTESVNSSRRVSSRIANGQCLFVTRDAYEAMGRHALVKSDVAEDMMMAQRWFAAGRKVVAQMGTGQLSTRMYTSLRELVEGWGKNVFAGARDAMPGGRVGRALFPLLFLLPPVTGFAPLLVLLASLVTNVPHAVLLWAALAQGLLLFWWIWVYAKAGESPLYAFLTPLGALLTFLIFFRAQLRGRRVEWKGREYALSRVSG